MNLLPIGFMVPGRDFTAITLNCGQKWIPRVYFLELGLNLPNYTILLSVGEFVGEFEKRFRLYKKNFCLSFVCYA